jgi:phosphate butyryltransferase
MVFHSFDEMNRRVRQGVSARRVAVANAADRHTLEAVMSLRDEGVIRPLLVGERAAILRILSELETAVEDGDIFDAPSATEAAACAVRLVREGSADFIMKGHMETSDLLRAVVNKEQGLNLGRLMSHLAVNEVPGYHKLLVTTDGGMALSPTLEQKKAIILNAVDSLHALGYVEPKVGVLAASETVNEKLQDSVDATALKQMGEDGEIKGCLVEGPISLDLALVKERAAAKGYESPCAGDVDILVVPNITAGNILGKSLVEMANAKMAGLVVGARCPIVVTSRGSSATEKRNALMLAAAMTGAADASGAAGAADAAGATDSAVPNTPSGTPSHRSEVAR